MEKKFKAAISKAREQIDRAPESKLSEDNFASLVFENSKVTVPYLDTDKTTTAIIEEYLDSRDMPPGISFSDGPLHCAVYKVSIVGDISILDEVYDNSFFNSFRFIQSGIFYFRYHTQDKISGNNKVIEEIKQKAKREIEGIQEKLASLEKLTEDFNERSLKNFISEHIQNKSKIYDTKLESTDKLNPFI